MRYCFYHMFYHFFLLNLNIFYNRRPHNTFTTRRQQRYTREKVLLILKNHSFKACFYQLMEKNPALNASQFTLFNRMVLLFFCYRHWPKNTQWNINISSHEWYQPYIEIHVINMKYWMICLYFFFDNCLCLEQILLITWKLKLTTNRIQQIGPFLSKIINYILLLCKNIYV